MGDVLPMKRPDLNHSDPLSTGARVQRSRLARVLNTPTLYDDQGRLSRIVAVYPGSINCLIALLVENGFRIDMKSHPRHESVPEVEGCSLLDVGRGVLVGHWDDIDETLTEPGRLDAVLGPGAREDLLSNRHLSLGGGSGPPIVSDEFREAMAGVEARACLAETEIQEPSSVDPNDGPDQDQVQREILAAVRSGDVQRPRCIFWVAEFPKTLATFDLSIFGHASVQEEAEHLGEGKVWELSAPWPWSLVADEGLGVCLYSPDGQIRITAEHALETARAEKYGFRVEREMPK